jgi:2-oxo-4-hydroxy-4-carboxy-5-ureidoimidazoline decarboxylase
MSALAVAAAASADALLDLDALNRADDAAFVAALGGVFEHSPWVAEAAAGRRPFVDIDALHAAMIGAVRALPREQQIRFLCQHPELAGKEAEAGTMTDHSTAEQAGLNALTRAELHDLRTLNADYLQRHGFPFVIAVLANTRAQIFAALRTRTGNDTAHELAAGLDQIAIITRLRLGRLFGEPRN